MNSTISIRIWLSPLATQQLGLYLDSPVLLRLEEPLGIPPTLSQDLKSFRLIIQPQSCDSGNFAQLESSTLPRPSENEITETSEDPSESSAFQRLSKTCGHTDLVLMDASGFLSTLRRVERKSLALDLHQTQALPLSFHSFTDSELAEVTGLARTLRKLYGGLYERFLSLLSQKRSEWSLRHRIPRSISRNPREEC